MLDMKNIVGPQEEGPCIWLWPPCTVECLEPVLSSSQKELLRAPEDLWLCKETCAWSQAWLVMGASRALRGLT